MKKINLLLRKCKSLSRQLGRSSSYSNLRSKSTREDHFWVQGDHHDHDHNDHKQGDQKSSTIIFVGSAKKRYMVSTKHLSHPLFEALLDKSSTNANNGKVIDRDDHDHDHRAQEERNDHDRVLVVKCEVVLFDHLLWMLENADPITFIGNNSESLEELAALYVF